MYHETMFKCTNWCKSKNKYLQTRMAYSMLMIVNFANSVLLTLQAFGTESVFSFGVFILNTAIVLSALYGLYNLRPLFIAPNVIFKVTLSSGALFYALQLIESGNDVNVSQLCWLLLSVVLFVFEVHAMFSASFGILKELNKRERSKPPPSYTTVMGGDAPPPTYEQALAKLNKPVVLDIEQLEEDVVQVEPPKIPKTTSTTSLTPSTSGPKFAPLAEVEIV